MTGVLDILIPPSGDGRIPGAGELGIANDLTAAVATDPDGSARLEELLSHLEEPGSQYPLEEAVARVESQLPTAFQYLLALTYAAYYGRADVRPHFGVSEKPVHPHGYDVAPEPADFIDQLTAPVRSRGRCYREA